MPLSGKRVGDRRVQKTQRLLRDALFSLIHEKTYDSIAVNEILDRADVGRSTFYTHFRGKDELLVSGIHDMLRSIQPAVPPSPAQPYERIVRFSLPILEALDRQRRSGAAMMGIRDRAIIHAHLREALAELIADDVRKDLQARRNAERRIPPELLIRYMASTFVLTLNWWVESRSPLSPKEVDEFFRMLTLPAVAANLE